MPRATSEAHGCRASQSPPPGRADRQRARRRPKRRGGRVSARAREALRSHCRRPDARRWRPVPAARPTRAEERFCLRRLRHRRGAGDGEGRASGDGPSGREAIRSPTLRGGGAPRRRPRRPVGLLPLRRARSPAPLDRCARRVSAQRSRTSGGARPPLLPRPPKGARRPPSARRRDGPEAHGARRRRHPSSPRRRGRATRPARPP